MSAGIFFIKRTLYCIVIENSYIWSRNQKFYLLLTYLRAHSQSNFVYVWLREVGCSKMTSFCPFVANFVRIVVEKAKIGICAGNISIIDISAGFVFFLLMGNEPNLVSSSIEITNPGIGVGRKRVKC